MSLERLAAAWERSDRLFGVIADEAWLEQPIALRQPLLFYLGHLPGVRLEPARPRPPRPSPPSLPTSTRSSSAASTRSASTPTRRAPSGPSATRSSSTATACARGSRWRSPTRPSRARARAVAAMVVEHELMHHETLLYMLQELDHALKRRPADWPALPVAGRSCTPGPRARSRSPRARRASAPVRGAIPFGWDNEFPEHRVHVAAFAHRRPAGDERGVPRVRRRRRLRGSSPLACGGLGVAARGAASSGRTRGAARRAVRRSRSASAPCSRTSRSTRAADWPVVVSWAEAAAYARWRGARLLTEAEWHRAAGTRRAAGRGDQRGNVDFRHGSPLPVGSHPEGASAWGVLELVGNGWEWTASPFEPLPRLRADAPLPWLLGRLLRRRALRPARRLVGDGRGAAAAELPQLVPAALPVRVLEVPLRPLALRPAAPGRASSGACARESRTAGLCPVARASKVRPTDRRPMASEKVAA